MRTLIWATVAFSVAAVSVAVLDQAPAEPAPIAKDRWIDGLPTPALAADQRAVRPVVVSEVTEPAVAAALVADSNPGPAAVPPTFDDRLPSPPPSYPTGSQAYGAAADPGAPPAQDLRGRDERPANGSRWGAEFAAPRQPPPLPMPPMPGRPSAAEELLRPTYAPRARGHVAGADQGTWATSTDFVSDELGSAALAASPTGSRARWGALDVAAAPRNAAPVPPVPPALAAAMAGAPASDSDTFINSYYYFPTESGGAHETPLHDASCNVIANVSRSFFENVCVQGSGRVASGLTVSYARRGCACAAVCARTGQQICFEKLDPARYPSGRGATGRPVEPLRTVAVDTSIIPLGAPVFIPEFVGVARPDGSAHDGCFVAEDRGMRIVGRRVDVFAGDIGTMRRWNGLVPSNRGVHVRVGDPRCAGSRAHR